MSEGVAGVREDSSVNLTIASGGLVEVDEHAGPLGLDHGQRLVDDVGAVAGGRLEQIAVSAVGVDANQRVRQIGHVAENERRMTPGTESGGVGVRGELTVPGLQRAGRGALHEAFMLEAVPNEIGDRDDPDVELACELGELRQTGHRAVLVHDFADYAAGLEAGEDCEIDGRFRLARAGEDAAGAGAEWKDMPRAGEVGGPGVGTDGDSDRVGAVRGGDAGGDALRRLHGDRKGCTETGGVGCGHGRQFEGVTLLRAEGEADEASPMTGHKVDGLGGNVFGGHGKVALVLAVFVVDHDEHATGPEVREGLWDGSEGHGATS